MVKTVIQLNHFKRAVYNARNSIFPVLQIFAQILWKGLVTSKSWQSSKIMNPYKTLSLGLLTEIAVFLAMMPWKKYIIILRSFLLRTAVISQKFLVSGLC